MKWSTDGKLSTFMKPCGRSNGLCFDAQGQPLGLRRREERDCGASTRPREGHRRGQGLRGQAAERAQRRLAAARRRAVLHRSVSTRGRTGSAGRRSIAIEGVYYLAPDRKRLIRVVDDLVQPNGIIGTPDGKTLYVADIGGGKTYAYDIQPDGTLTGKKLFCKLGSDGMTIDDEATST